MTTSRVIEEKSVAQLDVRGECLILYTERGVELHRVILAQ